ncbi:MAG: sensor domain-containing diguanylate cyclase [Betaproteobacteria bacterium]
MKDEQNNLPLQDRIRLVRIRTFFDNARGNTFGFMMAGGFFFASFYGTGVSHPLLFAWLALLILVSVCVFIFERHVQCVGISTDNIDRFYRLRILLGSLACSLCGATVVFLPEQQAGAVHAFVFIVASALVTVSYMIYATSFVYGLTVNVLVLLPYTLFVIHRYLAVGDTLFLLLGCVAVVWQILVVQKAHRVSRSAIEMIVATERLRDEIAERESAQAALGASEVKSQQLAAKLRLMCDNVPDMIWSKDMEGRYTFVNTVFCEKVLGVTDAEEPIGKTFDFFAQRERELHPDDPEWHTFGQHSMDIHQHTLSREEPTIYEESGYLRGGFVFLEVHQARLSSIDGEVIGVVGSARDITERKASENFVHHLAHHDVLTDLPNRILLNDRLRQAIALARRDRGKLAVLFIDLDRLKQVNDTLGHDVGDLLLKEVAQRMCEMVTRQADTVARLGGDEFVVLLQRVNMEQDAATVAEKIVAILAQPFTVSKHVISISASIGIAIYPQHGEENVQLLKNADMAMYSAKASGRNGFRLFDESMAQE